ncbi:MAG TPA: hypothetical protein DCG19_02370 [Cryomorphaceae bacterium]|nr:hypothetical protein [Cryomorphaceae bacterium]|tara:strand:+ start:261 stop:554 length:294 start_codon:yes stop_codon:yes gene_type:complete
MSPYYVYILQCKDGTYYTGMTNDLEKRLAQHQEGYDDKAYTFRRRPVRLMWSVSFTDARAAMDVEKQIKGWSRKKKEALIRGDYASLPALARKNFDP